MTIPRRPLARQVRAHLVRSLEPSPESGCTKETRRCRDARDYRVDLRPCCRAHIRQIVVDTIPVLQEYGVTFWADYGTLLGAVRNPMLGLPAGIIPHDKDADFGITNTDYVRLCRVRQRLERMGYNVLIRPQARSMKVRLSKTNDTNVDFFRWLEKPSGIMYRIQYASVDQFKGRHFPKDFAFPLTTIEWEGLSLPAPKDPAGFCAFRYGPNWMTPIRANNDGVRR
jgi:phosphorylcholine metabolism protein LicD